MFSRSGGRNLETVLGALLREFPFGDDWKANAFLHEGDTSVLLWSANVTATSTGKQHFFNVATVFT